MASTDTYNPSRDDFAAMLDESFAGGNLQESSVIKGKVVAIEKDMAVIDVGLKTEGRVPLREFAGPGRDNEIKVGDTVEVFLDRIENALGEAVLSRDKARREESWGKLEKAFNNNEKVSGVIFNQVKGGFTVDLDGEVAFLPRSQLLDFDEITRVVRLFKERGIDPVRDFKQILYSGGHDATVLAVLNGKVDAGGPTVPYFMMGVSLGGIHTALETVARIAIKRKLAPCCRRALRVEQRNLDEHVGGRLAASRAFTAHHAREQPYRRVPHTRRRQRANRTGGDADVEREIERAVGTSAFARIGRDGDRAGGGGEDEAIPHAVEQHGDDIHLERRADGEQRQRGEQRPESNDGDAERTALIHALREAAQHDHDVATRAPLEGCHRLDERIAPDDPCRRRPGGEVVGGELLPAPGRGETGGVDHVGAGGGLDPACRGSSETAGRRNARTLPGP